MSWIKTIAYEEADATLQRMYDRVKGPDGTIDNVLSIHSLRPHTLKGHMTLYKSVLHNANNSLPKWYLETLGIYVSFLNNCAYCVAHHLEGLTRLLESKPMASEIMKALETDLNATLLEPKYKQGLRYAKEVTQKISDVSEADLKDMKKVGFTDGEILEVNQVVSYFNYVNRTVLGLGVTTEGDVLGLSPNDSQDPSNWKHQ